MLVIDVQRFNYGFDNYLCKGIAIFIPDTKANSHKTNKMPYQFEFFNYSAKNCIN